MILSTVNEMHRLLGENIMTLNEILSTERKIKYVNDSGMDLRMFDAQLDQMIFADSTEPPEDLADIIRVEYVKLGDERRCIIYAA